MKTIRLQQTRPRIGKKLMNGAPGHWFLSEEFSGEKIIVESWETPKCYRHGWRVMRGSQCLASGDSKRGIGIQATANSASRWIAKRSARYAALGVK